MGKQYHMQLLCPLGAALLIRFSGESGMQRANPLLTSAPELTPS